jgi:hypothetical protein
LDVEDALVDDGDKIIPLLASVQEQRHFDSTWQIQTHGRKRQVKEG